MSQQNRREGAIAIYHAGIMLYPNLINRQTDLEAALFSESTSSPERSLGSCLKGIYQQTSDWEKTYLQHKFSFAPIYQTVEWGQANIPSGHSHPSTNTPSQIPPALPDPIIAFAQKKTPSVQSAEVQPCGGVTCPACMDRLVESFRPVQLASNLYYCSPQNDSLIPPHSPFVATIPDGVFWAKPQTSAWLVCDEIAVITSDDYVLGDLSRF
ncbi:MAG: hypothetical protein F6K35_40560 [Okeania sp. SIO2H7]|nr:hypothetical protein [Okeania sp. SIO2H7]